jgi:hypothetical protein
MAQMGIGSYGSGMGKVAGDMPSPTGGIKPPTFGTNKPGLQLARTAKMSTSRPSMGTDRAPGPNFMNEGRLPGAGAAAPIKQAAQVPQTPGVMAPPPPMASLPGGTTPASRAAARAQLYGAGGAGWENFGGAPPDPSASPAHGGGFMAGPQSGPFAPGPPQQGDPMQMGGDFMGKLQRLAQVNPAALQQILALLG